jgi:PAS domain S-box-containing protein
MDDAEKTALQSQSDAGEVTRFAESYASFSRIINSLQRRYIELEEEFSQQNEQLARANQRLVELSEQNLAVTEFLNSILNSISAGVVAVDQYGCITHANPAASVILGMNAQGLTGRYYRDAIPTGEPPDACAVRAVEAGREVSSVEKKVELPDGTRLRVSVSTAILRDDQGRSVGAVEVFQDLTRIKKMEQEIARLNTLAALGEMAATIAHEVRNPLSGIAGFAALLEKELAEDDPRRRLVGKVIRGVNSLNDTVTTLLNYTRLEELNCSEVIYAEFLAAAVSQCRQDFGDKLGRTELVISSPQKPSDSSITLCCDRLLLRQVLFNVISNSLDVLRGAGRIEIGYRLVPREEALAEHRDRLLLSAGETVLETIVADDGPGIDPEHIERVFAPFFTTKKDGAGLGLAVAWKIMKAHGGDIIAENGPAGGAQFRLVMPVRLGDVVEERV